MFPRPTRLSGFVPLTRSQNSNFRLVHRGTPSAGMPVLIRTQPEKTYIFPLAASASVRIPFVLKPPQVRQFKFNPASLNRQP